MPRLKKSYTATIYLIHLAEKLAHSQHYIGYTIKTPEQRLQTHKSGTGSKMLAHCNKVGIDYSIVRTWTVTAPTKQAAKNAGLNFEHSLKKLKKASCKCPVCKQQKLLKLMKCLTKSTQAFMPMPVSKPVADKQRFGIVRLMKPLPFTGFVKIDKANIS